jgi:large repetitive protein
MFRPFTRVLRVPAAALVLFGSAGLAATPASAAGILALSNGVVTETDSGQQSMVFTMTNSSVSPTAISAEFFTANVHLTLQAGDATPGAACTSGVDYIGLDRVVTIPANANPPQVTVSVPICGDLLSEPNESFAALLRNVQNSDCFELCGGIGTILDDELPGVSTTNSRQFEGDIASSARQMAFTVKLNRAVSTPVTVSYRTVDALGVSAGFLATDGLQCAVGVDYAGTKSVLTFSPGQTSATVSVPICGDTRVEPKEFLGLQLYNVSTNATLTDSYGEGLIIDDD